MQKVFSRKEKKRNGDGFNISYTDKNCRASVSECQLKWVSYDTYFFSVSVCVCVCVCVSVRLVLCHHLKCLVINIKSVSDTHRQINEREGTTLGTERDGAPSVRLWGAKETTSFSPRERGRVLAEKPCTMNH